MKEYALLSLILATITGCDGLGPDPYLTALKTQAEVDGEMIKAIQTLKMRVMALEKLDNGSTIQSNITDMGQKIHDLEYRLDHLQSGKCSK